MKIFDVIAYNSKGSRTRILVKENKKYYFYFNFYIEPLELLEFSCFNPIDGFSSEEEALKAMEKYDNKHSLFTTYLGDVL